MRLNNIGFAHNYVQEQLRNCVENDQYIVFEALIRNKDKVNPVIQKTMLLRTWYIDSIAKFDKHVKEMRYLCDITGARLYMVTDVKSTRNFTLNLLNEIHKLEMNVMRCNEISVKGTIKLPLSVIVSDESSVHNKRKYLIDIDIEDETNRTNAEEQIIKALPENVSYDRLSTVNGAHLIIDRNNLPQVVLSDIISKVDNNDDVTIKYNAMTVIYYNTECVADYEV